MEFFLTVEDLHEQARRVSREYREALATNPPPPELRRLDETVSEMMLETFQSEKGEQFRAHLKEAQELMSRDPDHVGIDYVFRSDYALCRCREVWRYALTREAGVQLRKSKKGYQPYCMTCKMGYGYVERERRDWKWVGEGSMYTEQIVDEEFKLLDRKLFADVMQMRGKGDFDEPLRLSVAKMNELRLLAGDYAIFYVSVHRLADGRSAICPGFYFTPAFPASREDYATLIRYGRTYHRPCETCKGEGCIPESP